MDRATVLDPTPAAAIERPLAADEVQRFSLPVVTPGTFETVVEQRGIDLELAVLDPGGEPLVTVDRAGPPSAESATWLAETPGTYSLEVRTWPASGAGSYALRIVRLREPTAQDRAHAEADRRFAEAEALRGREDRESCRLAVPLYHDALDRVRALGDRRQEAEILQRLGWVHRKYLEEERTAIEYYQGALALFESLGEESHAASILNNLGRAHYDLGELAEAVNAWNRALPIMRRLQDPAGEASSLGNLALAHRYLGDVQEALDAYDRSLELLRAAGGRAAEGRALNNRGRFYVLLGENRQALADLAAALAISREIGDRRFEAAVLTAIGRIHESRGDVEPAQDALEKALALRIDVEDRRGRAVTERALGSLYARLGRGDEAAAFDRRALADFRELGAPREVAGALLALGQLAVAAERPDGARPLLREALSGFRAIRDPIAAAETLFALARCERAGGDPRTALALTEDALREIELVRSRLGSHSLRTSFFATQQDYYDLQIGLLMDLHRLEPEAGHDREALAASERARVRSLVDLLAESGVASTAGADPELLAEKRDLERRLAALEQERLELGAGQPAKRVAAIEAGLDGLVRDYRALCGKIRASSPSYAALTEPRTLSAEEIQRQLLGPDTVLLEVHLGDRASVLWLVTVDSITSFELPSRAVIEAAARRAYELLEVSHLREYREATGQALSELSRMVLGPVSDRLAERRLLISGAGALQLIPFAALPLPGASGSEPLVGRHEIVTLPSASALAVLRARTAGRARPAGTVAVLADPVFEATDPRLAGGGPAPPGPDAASTRGADRLGRLPYSAGEAASILRLAAEEESYEALGFAATREAATSPALGGYRIVHFATHGALDGEHPELSRLVFSRFDAEGRARNGVLFAHQIYDLELPVDLVVLSACESALGRQMRGEGLVGLTQGFFHAGAARVVVSLWRVDDRATAELMARFYEGMLVDRLAPAAALRRAQLAIRSEPGWQAPYYWAGFVLQGEWR